MTPLDFINRNINTDDTSYQQQLLRGTLEAWTTQHNGANRSTLQQNWDPAHSAGSTIVICQELSRLCGEGHLAAKLAGSQPNGSPHVVRTV
ncbi:hypothetical protein KIN20_030322 [Parelaphostrongylus tenuis]|uniref:Uncharacterized protein n=1 Tax=Parelaphostrongylus tenuis TaxID=148309 RepID=A0AAD5R3K2_PARTN|nr:hypothetical protein KIN20_030322 [Parelaphostrongylus tenuis]